MALGDSDITGGVFFAEFGDTITFGMQSTKGNVDGPGKDAIFDKTSVSDVEYRVELGSSAFNPMPKSKDRLSITTGRFAGAYQVRCVDPMDDGATVEIKLRKL